MLQKLRTILFGPNQHKTDENPKPTCAQVEPDRAKGPQNPCVLLSRRLSNPEEDIPGFDEQYYCPKCDDYFVLAWHSKSSPLAESCDPIPDTHPCLREINSADAKVFCPQCQTDHAMYGPIQHPDTPRNRAEDALVYEAYEFPLPPDVLSMPEGSIKIGGHIIEKVVMLVTGEFPEGVDVRDFAYSGFTNVVLSRHGEGVLVSAQGGISLHVIRTNTIVDETDWLTPFLQREVYRTQNWGTKLFLTYGILDLKPPLKQALFCLLLSDQ